MSLEALVRIGTIPIIGDIEYPNITPVINSLLYATAITKLKAELPKSLSIYVSSSGGDFNIAVGIFDLLRQLSKAGIDIHTYAFGQVASSGLLIFASGDVRTAYPNTSFCVHHVWDDETKKVDETETEKYLRILSSRITTSLEELNKQIRCPDETPFDWTFDCAEAFRIGLTHSPSGGIVLV